MIKIYGEAIPIVFLVWLFISAAITALGAYLIGMTLTPSAASYGGLFYIGMFLTSVGFAATVFIAAAGAVRFFG